MELYERSNGIYRKGREYQMSPPNSAAAMLHWRTLVNLVNMLDVDQQQELRAISTEYNLLREPVNTPSQPVLSSTPEVKAEVPTSAELEGEEPLPTPVVADAHCHVDLLLSQLHTKSYDDAKDDFFHPEESVELVQIIPCYAFPNMFPRPWMLKNLPQIGKKYMIRFHPQSAASSYPDYFEKFRELAEKEDTIIIGEVGLDYTQGILESNIDIQHWLLWATALVDVELKKPFVIHCHGGWNVNNWCATDDCIHILQQVVPKSFPVYVHCFTGGKRDDQKQLQSFHSCVFGFSGALLDPKKHHHKLLGVIRLMDLGHILLESDALLLLPPKYHELM